MNARLVATVVLTLGLNAACTQRQPETAQQPSGEWRSTARVGDRPEVTLMLAADARTSGSMSLRGERRGNQEWTTMSVDHPFWNGTQMTFETVLPDDEGKVYWTFRAFSQKQARLTAVAEDSAQTAEPIQWALEKQ